MTSALTELVHGVRRYVGWRALVVVGGLLAMEVGLRHWTHYGEWVINDKDPVVGWHMLPSQHAWSRHYDIPIYINKWGFRGPDWPAPVRDEEGGWVKDESIFRVAVIGDSISYGISVPFDQIYTQQLEQLLREDFERRGIEKQPLVMNFAVQGYVFQQSMSVYEQLISHWRPDVLIAPLSPHAILPFEGGEPGADFTYASTVMRSATYDYLFKRWIHPARTLLGLTDQLSDGEPAWPAAQPASKQLEELEGDFVNRPYEKKYRHYWIDDLARKRQLATELEQQDGSLVLLNMPSFYPLVNPRLLTPLEIYGPWLTSLREDQTAPKRVFAIDAYPRARAAMPNLIPELYEHISAARKAKRPDGIKYYMDELQHLDEYLMLEDDQGHLSARGHRVVAEAVFEGLQSQGLLP